MRDLPTGSVTLLFTDIEGSTKLLQELGEGYAKALSDHRLRLRNAFSSHRGVEVDTQGDAFFYAFPSATEAVDAALEGQAALADGPILVRIGVHTGEPTLTDEGYVGLDVHRAARICAAGHGGQILISEGTRRLLDGASLLDLGEHRLKDLSETQRLYQLGDAEFPPLRTLHQTNLPVPATPFLGRERELPQVLAFLRSSQMVTLTGPGGSGKTRLAAQAAAEAAEDFPDGVWWVSLAAVTDPALVLDSIGQVVGAKEELAEHIGQRKLLLLLDNFEQLLPAATEIGELMAKCAGLRCLVTSREPLRLAAEQEYPVPPFASEEAVAFFTARARAARPDFEPSAVVAEICAQLDNLPLALDLAAARVTVLSADQILSRLGQALSLLTSGARDAPERQRTLTATIAWSYDLLNEDEQRLFARLAVFAGGSTLQAAEEVCGADLDTTASLVGKSLLRQSDERFWMLETIREYAREQLDARGEVEVLRRRHAEYFGSFGRLAEHELRGEDAAQWLAALERDIGNIRAALAWSLEQDEVELGLGLANDLYRFWIAHGRIGEASNWFAELIGRAATSDSLGIALHTAADLALWQSDNARAAELSARAVPLLRAAGHTKELCSCLTTEGGAVGALGDYERSVSVLEEALALAQQEGIEFAAASALNNLAAVYKLKGDYGRALEYIEACLEIIEPAGDPLQLTVVLGNVGEIAIGFGDHRRAIEALERSLTLGRECGNSRQVAWSLAYLALVRLLGGETERSQELASESLPHAFEARDTPAIEACMQSFAGVAAAAGDAERAARLWGAAERLRESLGWQPGPTGAALAEQYISLAREALVERFAALEEEGRNLSLEDAVALAAEQRQVV